MKWNKHFTNSSHAFLSPSSYTWIKYDEKKLINAYNNSKRLEEGVLLHKIASDCINNKVRLEKSGRPALANFVNDAISYGMDSEVLLYYSKYCFGTADAISFKRNTLIIHDLKTGTTPVKMEQLLIYASLFCLEYNVNPKNISIELRIYQGDDIIEYIPECDLVEHYMNIIISHNNILEREFGENE